MSAAHAWRCGRCGTRVAATSGAILAAFHAHATTCPARLRPRPMSARPPARTPRRSVPAARPPYQPQPPSPKETDPC